MPYGLRELTKEIELCNRMISSQQQMIEIAEEFHQIASELNRDQLRGLIEGVRDGQRYMINARNQMNTVLDHLHKAVGPLR